MEKENIDFSKLGFIIGAGAHAPYGMPVSFQLTEKIKQLNHPRIIINMLTPFNGDNKTTLEKKDICRIIRDLQIVLPPENPASINTYDIEIGAALDRFLDTFAGSQVYSIDAFLAKYIGEHADAEGDALIQIGKVVLIYYIAKFENETPVGYHQFDWIQFIINDYLKDASSRDRFFAKPPIIYSFNYDRIFERSIMNHLVNFHFIDEQKAIEMVKSLNIKHIYGCLGSFERSIDLADIVQIKEAVSLIRVIGEERMKNTEAYSIQIYEEIRNLTRVYILGYGYDRLNNDLLFSRFFTFFEDRKKTVPRMTRSHPIPSFPQFVSTNIKLSEEECRKIYSEIGFMKINLGTDEKNLGKNDCLRLIKVTAPFHQAFSSGIHQARAPKPKKSWVTDYD